MQYLLTKDFTQIEETSGTVQNTDKGAVIEISDTPTVGTGILIYPLQKHTFRDTTVWLRCIDGWAEARVVPFKLDEEGGGEDVSTVILNGEEYQVASYAEINELLDSLFD